MSDDRNVEEGFFDGRDEPAAPARPPRRESPLLARSPVFAALVLAVAGWLLAALWPDVAYHFSSTDPLVLKPAAGQPVPVNRLVQVTGVLAPAMDVTEGRSGAPRVIGVLPGTHLLVDRPQANASNAYEGRVLPAGKRTDYAEALGVLRARSGEAGSRPLDGWQVLRDGERPRGAWGEVAMFVVLLALAAVNLRALVKGLFSRQ